MSKNLLLAVYFRYPLHLNLSQKGIIGMHISPQRLILILLSTLVLCSATFANDKLLDLLLHKGIVNEEEYNKLKLESEKKFELSYDKGVNMVARNGKFNFKVGGRLMFDAAFYDTDKIELGDGTEIRRSRISVSGTISDDWEFEADYDFANNAVNVKDISISYNGFNAVNIKLGNFKEPFSLEENTSSRYLTFMERALPNVFAPGRNIGIGVNSKLKSWTWAAGVFGQSVGDEPDDDEGYGASVRLTTAPMDDDRRVLHLGIGASYRAPDDKDREVRFRERPESHKSNKRLVNTGTIANVDDYTTIGLEAALILGAFSLQGEYIKTRVDREKNFTDVDFSGGYVYGSWFITGESRNYKSKSGKFGRIKPLVNAGDHGGVGAWELAIRYSTLNLNDNVINGGIEENTTIGLNWYLNPQLRFMTNFVYVNSEKGGVHEDPRIFQLRAQIDF